MPNTSREITRGGSARCWVYGLRAFALADPDAAVDLTGLPLLFKLRAEGDDTPLDDLDPIAGDWTPGSYDPETGKANASVVIDLTPGGLDLTPGRYDVFAAVEGQSTNPLFPVAWIRVKA